MARRFKDAGTALVPAVSTAWIKNPQSALIVVAATCAIKAVIAAIRLP
jgi:hypothetical protein